MKRLGALLITTLALSACDLSQLNFKLDERVSFQSPGEDEHIIVPLDITWTHEDLDVFESAGDDGVLFALFVNRPPMAPGKDITSLADDTCKRREDCPDAEWLADRYIFITNDTSITLDRLPGQSKKRRNIDLTIVLIDGDGRRVGESAFVRSIVALPSR